MRKLFVAALLGSAFLFPTASYAESTYLKLGVGESTYSGDPNKLSTAGLLAHGRTIYPNMFADIGYIDFSQFAISFLKHEQFRIAPLVYIRRDKAI